MNSRLPRASQGLPMSLTANYPFLLVVAFGRCKFKLTLTSVGQILQATIGGSAQLFNVSQLSDRVFKFMVASKEVGLFIHNLDSCECLIFINSPFTSGEEVDLTRNLSLKLFWRRKETLGNQYLPPILQPVLLLMWLDNPRLMRTLALVNLSRELMLFLSGANATPITRAPTRISVHQQITFPKIDTSIRFGKHGRPSQEGTCRKENQFFPRQNTEKSFLRPQSWLWFW